MSDQALVLDVQGVSKNYSGTPALAETSFSVERGECFALLGPNGSGKTTLLRILTDIVKPDTGTFSLLGSRDIAVVKDRIGYLPEERGLYKKQKIGDTLTYFGELKGLSASKARARARAVLAAVGMAEHFNSRAEILSKGMAQRVQFAAALIQDPEFVIFDEPFSGLDPASAHDMQALLIAEKARGRTLLLSTHQMAPVERLCDRLLMLRYGKTMLYGSIADVRSRYDTHEVRVEHEGALPEIAGVTSESIEPGVTRLRPPAELERKDLLRALIDGGAVLTGFSNESPSLEDIFIQVAGAHDDVR